MEFQVSRLGDSSPEVNVADFPRIMIQIRSQEGIQYNNLQAASPEDIRRDQFWKLSHEK